MRWLNVPKAAQYRILVYDAASRTHLDLVIPEGDVGGASLDELNPKEWPANPYVLWVTASDQDGRLLASGGPVKFVVP